MIIYKGANKEYVCDYCGKNEKGVKQLVTGNQNSAICNDCVETCVKMLESKGIKICK